MPHLKFLHPLKQIEQLLRLGINVEPRSIQRDQQFVRRLERRKATGFRLALNNIAARRGIGKHDPRKFLQTEACAQHRPDESPRGIE